MFWRTSLFFLMIVTLMGRSLPWVAAQDWFSFKGRHFIVFYNDNSLRSQAQKVLGKAEEGYETIAEQLGYSRYQHFWTWGERVAIFIYADKEDFLRETGQPSWSLGYAGRDAFVSLARKIVTYNQEENFLNGILQHEMSHLMLRDFVGTVPVWFDEGIAQYQEVQKREPTERFMRSMIAQGVTIPLPVLMHWDIRTLQNPHTVALFYAQSLSLVDFLIRVYGQRNFLKLCYRLKEGDHLTEALRKTYGLGDKTLQELEEKWVKSFSSY